MNNQQWINEINKGLVDTYYRLPVVLEKGAGVWVWDVEGKQYMDMLSCYSAVNAGHCHPRIVEAIKKQASKLDAVSNAFYHVGLTFARELAQFCGYDKALLMNTGTEAFERSELISRKIGYVISQSVRKYKAEIIVCKGNFHGRTFGARSASDEPHYNENFGPFLPGFVKISFGNTEALEKAINRNTVAFITEPIQAEGGILIPPEGYLQKCKEICRRAGILFILDEIQTGLGRTGKMFCYQYEDAKPDLLITGKFLGGGQFPVSAILGPKGIVDIFEPGEDGSTYSGNPLACAVGSEVLKILADDNLDQRAMRRGQYFLPNLQELKNPLIKEVRGRGLLIGIELKPEAGGARKFCERLAQEGLEGLLCKETHTHTIRFTPPLIIKQTEIDWAMEKIQRVFK